MSDVDREPELTEEELRKAIGRKPKWLVPAAISIACLAAFAGFYYFGVPLMQNISTAPTPMLAPPEPKPVAGELAELVSDTLDFEDLSEEAAVDSSDTLRQFISKLLATPVDTNQIADLPPTLFDTEKGLLSAKVTKADGAMDSGMHYEEMLISSFRSTTMEVPRMPWEEAPTPPAGLTDAKADTTPRIVETPLAEKERAEHERRKAELDSLRHQLATTEQALTKATDDRSMLVDRLDRLKSSVDSARTAELKKLAKIVGTMKPGAAAQMLAERSPDEVTDILFRVKPKTAAQILQNLPPTLTADIAARIVRR